MKKATSTGPQKSSKRKKAIGVEAHMSPDSDEKLADLVPRKRKRKTEEKEVEKHSEKTPKATLQKEQESQPEPPTQETQIPAPPQNQIEDFLLSPERLDQPFITPP
ncbi:hypothetical protein Dimus_038325 [Dionaea muscipula]